MIYIMYMTPTKKEAVRVGLMAKRIHAETLDKCVMLSDFAPDERAIFREPQHGKPRVRCHWKIATRNVALAGDTYAWKRAIELYDTKPYWLAYLISWVEHFKRSANKMKALREFLWELTVNLVFWGPLLLALTLVRMVLAFPTTAYLMYKVWRKEAKL